MPEDATTTPARDGANAAEGAVGPADPAMYRGAGPASAAAPDAPVAAGGATSAPRARRPGLLRRIFLMPEQAARAVANDFRPGSPGWPQYARAMAADEAASTLLRSRQALSFSDGFAPALLLLQEALRWALALRRGDASASPPRAAEAWAAFCATDEGAALRDALPAPERAVLAAALGRRSDEAYGPADAALRDELAVARALFARLLEPWQWRQSALDLVRLQRGLRIGITLLVLLVGAYKAYTTAVELRRGKSLALARSVTTSSTWGDLTTAAGAVDGVRDQLGFHTKDEVDPWVQIDLGEPRSIHEVLVHNRSDCCKERATPLRVEASLDGVTYQPLGRRDTSFDVWSLTFPKTTTRFVRLKAERRTMLHLNEIGIY
ncbi:MAG: discoidin domain-containing protein [Polyangiaceae bacterium]|jgi:F5/8 type C domain|nr:discoidin domain-containing protein [Polyangiaceae bacterium]